MAAQEFLDALSPEAEKRADAYLKKLDLIIDKVAKGNSMQIGGVTPSGTDSAIKQLQKDLKDTDVLLQKMQKERIAYAQTRRANSVQERVDNSIILQQQKQQATIISEVAGAYRKLSAQQAASATNVQNIVARGRLATQTQRQYNAELARAQKEFDGLNARVLKADAAVGRFNRNVGNYPKTLANVNQLLGALGVTLGAAGIALLAKDIFDTTRELQSLDLALKQITGSQEEAAKAQAFLSKTAEDYGINIQGLTKSYIGFYAGAKNAIEEGKISAQDIQQIFQSVAKASGALGLSAEQQEGAFLALQQMISKGNIQAEELRGQLSERLPGAFGILAKSMGVTEIQLNKLLKDGKVLAAEVLPAFAKELEKAYGVENLQRVETLNASVARLSNSWTDFVRALNDGDGVFSSSIAGLINTLAEAVKGASLILENAERERGRVLASIREKSYNDQLADYKAIENLDKDYVVKKNIFFQQEIQRLQDQVRANIDANNEIRKTANSGRYVEGGAEALTTNKAAIKALNNEIKSYYGRLAAGNEILKENNKEVAKGAELTDAQRKALEKLREERARSEFDRRLSDLERSKFIIEQKLKDEEKYSEESIKLQKELAFTEVAIATLKYKELNRLAKGNLDKQKIAANEYITALESIAKTDIKFPKPDLPDDFEFPTIDSQDAEESKEYVQDIIDLFEEWRAKAERIKDYIGSFTESFFDEAGLGTLFDILDEKIEGFGENAQVTALAVAEAFQEMYNFISKASQANFDQERETLERKYQIDRLFAGDNAAAIAELDKEREERQKEIAKREAKANKELAIFNIGLNAAQGIIGAFKDGNVIKGAIFAALIAGIAAAQIAAVNSQEIPQYWKGTDNHPGGLMMVNDAKGAKYREIIQTPDGKKHAPEGRNKLVNAPKGTKVFTAERSALMFDNGLNNILNERGISLSPAAPVINNNFNIDKLGDRIDAAISRIPQPYFKTDKEGLGNFIKTVSNGVESMNARTKTIPTTFKRN